MGRRYQHFAVLPLTMLAVPIVFFVGLGMSGRDMQVRVLDQFLDMFCCVVFASLFNVIHVLLFALPPAEYDLIDGMFSYPMSLESCYSDDYFTR